MEVATSWRKMFSKAFELKKNTSSSSFFKQPKSPERKHRNTKQRSIFVLYTIRRCTPRPWHSGMRGCGYLFVLSDSRPWPLCPGRQWLSVAFSFCMSVCSTRDLKVPTVTQKVFGGGGRGGSLQLERSGVSANPPLFLLFPFFLLPQLNTGQFIRTQIRFPTRPRPVATVSLPPPELLPKTLRHEPLLCAAFHSSWLHERLGEIYHVQVVNLL